jgi:chromosome segregation ATPase
MSMDRELKQALRGADDKLRALMGRRDRLQKQVSKHGKEVEVATRRIKKAQETLEQLTETTAENIAAWTDKITWHEDLEARSKTLHEEAEKEVNERIELLTAGEV